MDAWGVQSSLASPSREDDSNQVALPRQPTEMKLLMLETISELGAIGWHKSRDLVFSCPIRGGAASGQEPHDLPQREMVTVHDWFSNLVAN